MQVLVDDGADLGFFPSASSGLNSRPSRSASLRMPSIAPAGTELISASPWRWLSA